MTREQAIEVLNMVEAHGLADEAKRIAIEAIEQVNKIKAIIESPVYIQEDVFRYKAICEVFKSEEQA